MDTAAGLVRRQRNGFVVLGSGLVLGVAWGAFARLWMRFIATDPEFTWSGTLGIVIGFGIAGLGQAGSYLAARAGLARRRRTVVRVLGFITLLPLGVAAGASMLPAALLAAMVWGHDEWPRATRLLLAAACALSAVAVARIVADNLSLTKSFLALPWFLLIYAVIAWAARFTLGPQRDGWRPPMVVRLLGWVMVVGVAAIGVLLLGVDDL